MRLVGNNVETLPTDIIGMLMEVLSAGGFEDCYNFFVAWARTQRPSAILALLNGLPLRAMYKLANAGGASDKACFNRFFRIAKGLGVADAVLYERCRDMLCGWGSSEAHIISIGALADRGHFMSMVANFTVRLLYKQDSTVKTLQLLVDISEHREYKNGIGPVLVHLKSIFSVAEQSDEIRSECFGRVGCLIHSSANNVKPQNEHMIVQDCLFCLISGMSCCDGWGLIDTLGVPKSNPEVKAHFSTFLSGKTLKRSMFGGWKTKSDIPSLIQMYLNQEIQVDEYISHNMPLEDINQAFDLMKEGWCLRSVIHMPE
ncbi:hypothetical protein POM88_006407 [Heracleum sosnowskyi]|uniref:Uncharacterized protein n=1 Tax=Heracleum sosnowskyi TaxID=360622 RepID=A0AAD8N4Q5_9APIA|nr:hypothetical protein POM88_006407 [Heracleum sosnowskyi]